MKNLRLWCKKRWYVFLFLIVNLIAIGIVSQKEIQYIHENLQERSLGTMQQMDTIMENYTHSFQLFTHMMENEIKNHPDPNDIWTYLKSIDKKMLAIEGDTFDGLYMYYKGRYLYSWDTPYSQYEKTGYVATQRPWYKAAAKGNGSIVFTPPYMSYANHYILSTISQMQPDKETVFAYDIKMGDIQNLVTESKRYDDEQIMIFDEQGTLIGSSNALYLGGNLYASQKENQELAIKAKQNWKNDAGKDKTEKQKLKEEWQSAEAFYQFQKTFDGSFKNLKANTNQVQHLRFDHSGYFATLHTGKQFSFLVLVPDTTLLGDSMQIWLVPLLVLELLLIYGISRITKEQKNRELHQAYIELGQTQKRLEIALSAAQKAAAIDDLTGMMNFKSFRKAVSDQLESMEEQERGILIMIDGDHFKYVNDNYGHMIGDEVIKLSAQMIIGRIRTIDLASRLHGDEFSIFVSGTDDYLIAKKIMQDINSTLAKEAARRNMPSITMSAGAIIAKHGDTYTALAKKADEALYTAKATHDGQFASPQGIL